METTNVSQIHFVHVETQVRTIVHIGQAVRQSDREFSLDGVGPNPVRLRVSQVNPEDYDAPIMIELLNNTTDVMSVDGRAADIVGENQRALLNSNSILTIGDARFLCQLLIGQHLPRPALQATWLTLNGPVRDHNEDAIGVYRADWGNLFVIADGVGGAESGEIISEFAVNRIIAMFHERHRADPAVNWLNALGAAYRSINDEVRHFGQLSAASAGSTLTAVILVRWDVYVAHVGDSRLYHWNGINLRQMTTDHVTLVPDERGGIGATQRTILDKAIGKSEEIEPDLFTLRLQSDDRLILCTDGVYHRLQDEDIVDLIRGGGFNSLPERLINASNERFNDDNVSVIALRLLANSLPGGSREPAPKPMARVYFGYHPRRYKRLKATEELRTHDAPSLRDRLYLITYKATRRRKLRWWIVAVLVILIAVLLLKSVFFNANPLGKNSADPRAAGALTALPPTALVNTPVRPVTPVPTVTLTPFSTPMPNETTLSPSATVPLLPTITLPSDVSRKIKYSRAGQNSFE